MAQYVVTEPAEEDLREIAFYIGDDNLDAALSMLDRFTECFEMLASMPQVDEGVMSSNQICAAFLKAAMLFFIVRSLRG